MTIINSRESFLSHENKSYIAKRPDWVIGKVPDLCDYRKLSVENMEEAMKLAVLGAKLSRMIIPTYKNGVPLSCYFTQSLAIGASLIDRKTATKLDLDYEKYRSILCILPSRAGKSFLQAICCIGQAGANNIEVNIGAATMPKAQIIQKKVVELLPFANKKILDGLIVDSNNKDSEDAKYAKIERMSTQVSKEALKWKKGGSIGLFSTNESQKNAEVSSAGAIGIGGGYCVDGENQVLTHRGWVKLKDLEDGEQVAQYTKDRRIEFVRPSRVVRKYYKGDGYLFTPPATNDKIFMIPEHRQPLMNPKGEIVIKEAKDIKLYNYWWVIMAGRGTGTKRLTPLDRIAIACQADGCILKTTSKGNYYQIKVKKERKAHRLERLFGEAGMEVKIHQDSRGYYVCHFYMPVNCDKILSHWFGWDLDYDKAKAILDEIVEWDGYTYIDGTKYYSSKFRENTDWVQAVAAQAGCRSKTSIQHDKRKSTFSDIYRIHIKDVPIRCCEYATMKETSWDNMVYCVTVPSGMFLLKTESSTIITGNCALDEIQLMSAIGFRTSSRFMAENPDTKRFCVGNPMINGHFKEMYDDPNTFVIHANEITMLIEQRFSRRGIQLTGIPSYSDEYRYFIECEFPDEKTGGRFFSTLPQLYDEGKFGEPAQKWYFLGVDSAYDGGDGLVVSLLSYNKGAEKSWFILEDQIDLKKKYPTIDNNTTTMIALDIIKMYEKYNISLACIDYGMGVHLIERIRMLAPNAPLVPVKFASSPTAWRKDKDFSATHAANKRAEMHLDMRDICESELLQVVPKLYDNLVKEMREVNQLPARSKIQIEPKKNIKLRLGKSPDNLDSACLALHAAVVSGVLRGQNYAQAEEAIEVF